MVKNVGLSELIRRASGPISRTPMRLRDVPVTLERDRRLELESLLHLRDGFRAFSGALIVRPSVTVGQIRGVDDWNQLTLWRSPYRQSTEVYFFAETITGHQYGFYRDEVVAFDPETGEREHFAFDLDRWAQLILDDPEPIGEAKLLEYQESCGELTPTQRLQPSTPLSRAGGESVQYHALEDVELMRRYARLYRETTEAEPGEDVSLEWWLDQVD